MKRVCTRVVMLCVLLGLSPVLVAQQSPNLITDPGFESGGRGWKAQEGKSQLVTDAKQAHSGANAIRITAAQRGKEWHAHLFSRLQMEVVSGGRYICSAWVRGKGQAVVGLYEYCIKDGQTQILQRVALPTPVVLSDAWQRVEIVYRPIGDNVRSVAVFAHVTGEGAEMWVDDFLFANMPDPPTELSFGTIPAMTPKGEELAFSFEVKGNVINPIVEVMLTDEQGGTIVKESKPGPRANFVLKLPANLDGCCRLTCVEKTSGAAGLAFVDVCTKDECDACAAAAAQVKLQTPCHLVFVGDSLTALYRGHNYVDKVRAWLQGRFGDKVLVTNAGVGGDTITRVKERLAQDVLQLQPKPTHVFIFLGHNDSKLKSTTDYKVPVVLPQEFERTYREVVKAIQTQLGANVTIISATSSVYEITRETAARAAKAGKIHNLFGKPEALEQFNAIARKVAADLGAGYLDMYEPTRTHPDKPSLFTKDGVHINERGNRLVALEILKYLCR